MRKKISFIKFISIWGIVFLIGLGVTFICIDVVNSYRDFNLRAEQINSEYIDRQKQIIKQEVLRVVDMIRFHKSQSEELTKKKIKSRVYEAHSIALNIYQQNRNKESKTKIQQMVLDAIRPIRFENGIGYYFATRFDGIEMLFADRPQMEGLNLLNMQDTRGKYVIKDMIEIAKQADEGFYEYHWTKPGAKGNDFKKISFVKRFEPWDWFIGTGLYVDDIEDQIKAELLSNISRIRFGKEGYIFVNKLNGDALVSNGKLFSGTKKLWQVFNKNPDKMREIFEKEYRAALKPEGDYIHYSHIKLTNLKRESPKISFIFGLQGFQWLVGAGVYLDDVESDIVWMQNDLNNQIKAKIIYFSLTVTVVVGLFFLFFSWLNHRLKDDLNFFVSFFKKAAHSDEEIDRKNIKFIELDLIAEYANKMLEDRTLAVKALEESEALLKSIVQAAPTGIGVVIDRVIAQVNDKLCTITGYSIKELLGKSARMLYPTDEDFTFVGQEKYKQIHERGTGTVETRWQRKDGKVIDVLLSSTPLNPEDLSAGVTFTVLDITERKLAEASLRTSHQRFLTVLDSIDATVYVSDMETYEILFMNKYMIETFGRDMTGETCWQVFRGESAPCQHCSNDQLTDEYGKPTDVYVWQDKNPITGKWYINYDRAIEWTDGRLVKLQIATDITDIKRMEDELRQSHKMEAVGILAGGIAHDFNNILSIILGNAELALDDVPNWNPARFNLEEIKTASHRAKDVVRQLLSFARKTGLEKKPTNIAPIVEETLKMLRASIPTSVDIRQHIPDDVDTVMADPTQINQVLINLCTNAHHAMPNGGIIDITLENIQIDKNFAPQHPELPSGRYVHLVVGDTGHGISQAEIDRIFDPYFTTKDVEKGTGMGLAVVHGIVEDHQGIITVESEPGKGTTFNIFFPIVEQEPAVEIVTDEKLPTGNEKILFVDDEESIVKLGCQRLERLGYTVEATINPIKALDLFQSKPDDFDLVITDMTMPNMTGDKLIREILNTRSDIPVILCTGFSEKIDEAKVKAIGAADYIEKPLDKRDFAFKVRKVIDQAKGVDQR